MYGRSFEVDDKVMDSDFVLPIGKAKVEREGTFIKIYIIPYIYSQKNT